MTNDEIRQVKKNNGITNLIAFADSLPLPLGEGEKEGVRTDRQSLIYENKKHYIIATPIRSLHRL